MINNPYRERYRAIMQDVENDRVNLNNWPDHLSKRTKLVLDLYYALDEALGRIYELEQKLEGRERYSEESYD
jgi:hypothetical protein